MCCKRLSVIFKKIINKVLMKAALSKVKGKNRVVYLTFDDGPEEGITQFVLDELDKHAFKATFFCTGKNASKNEKLLQQIIYKGHTVANHTYSHLVSYNISHEDYVEDVEAASKVIKSILFRPPCGCLTLPSWLRLFRKYRIVYWSVNSGDSRKEKFDYVDSVKALRKTKAGDIILFHFSIEHAKATKLLLPGYLVWLHDNGFRSVAIE